MHKYIIETTSAIIKLLAMFYLIFQEFSLGEVQFNRSASNSSVFCRAVFNSNGKVSGSFFRDGELNHPAKRNLISQGEKGNIGGTPDKIFRNNCECVDERKGVFLTDDANVGGRILASSGSFIKPQIGDFD